MTPPVVPGAIIVAVKDGKTVLLTQEGTLVTGTLTLTLMYNDAWVYILPDAEPFNQISQYWEIA